MKYKMIAIDLDGTTVKMRNRISKQNLQAIKGAMASGVKVIIATGRSISAIKKIAQKLQIDKYQLPVIGFNGGVVYDFNTNQKLLENSFSISEAQEIFKLCNDLKLIVWGYAVNDDSKAYVNTFHSSLIRWMAFYTKRKKILVTENFMADKIYKFVITGRHKNMIIFKNKIKNYNYNIFNWSYRNSINTNIELSPSNVDKQQALAFLAKRYHIQANEIMAIGDGDNDIAMLKWAGKGIAMGNASKEVKAIADEITLHHRKSGLAASLKKYLK